MAAFLAFDVGAESGRAVLGVWQAGLVDIRVVCRFPNVPIRIGRSLRWDVDAILDGVREGLSAVAGERLSAIGVDTWGCDFGLVDRAGTLIDAPYHYRDHRTEGVMARVLERVGRDRVYGITGVQCLPFNTLYQLVAAREADAGLLDAAHAFLTMPDLVNHRLTGRMACEFTNATTTQCVDAHTSSWAVDLLSDLDIPTRLFGPIVEPGTVLGPLNAGIAPSLAGTLVVAPACHDTGSAFAAVDASGTTALLSSGTWSLLGTEVPSPVITDRSRALNFTNEGGVNGTTRLLKNIGGLWLLQACRRVWSAGGRDWSYEDLVAAATEDRRAFRSIVDPDHPSLLNPDDMVAAIAAYCSATGQPAPDGPAACTRTILESLALKYRVVLDALEEIVGTSFHAIRMVGGGSRNRLLAQYTADATGRPVLTGPVEATALGNIAVQAVATGHAASLAAARAVIDRSFPVERFEPLEPERWRAPSQRLRDYMELTCV